MGPQTHLRSNLEVAPRLVRLRPQSRPSDTPYKIIRKVVTPSREETVRYIWIVVGFVLVMMLIVFVLDFVLGYAANWVFGG